MKKRKINSKSINKKSSKKLPSKTMFLGLVVIIAVLIASKILSSMTQQVGFNAGPTINQVGVAEGRVNLTLSPASITMSPNSEQILTLSIDAGADYATLAQIELNYDPAKIGTPIVTQGDFLTSSIGSTKVQNGKITFTFITALPENGEQAGKKGSGTLATIKITPPIDGESSITFGDNSLVIITDATSLTSISSNMLKSANNATIKVGSGNAAVESANPSPSLSPDPSASPIASPVQSPSPSPAASPADDSNANNTNEDSASKPSAPTNLKYNCYDSGNKITLRWDTVTGITNYELSLDQITGDQDVTKTVSGREIDLSVTPNTKYNWSVVSVNGGIKSDKSSISDISCSGSNSSNNNPSPSPSLVAAASPTIKPTAKPNAITKAVQSLIKPKSPSPTPAPTISSTNEYIALNPTPTPGSLADVFKSPTPTPSPRSDVAKPSFFAKIFLGWQALFFRLVESLAN